MHLISFNYHISKMHCRCETISEAGQKWYASSTFNQMGRVQKIREGVWYSKSYCCQVLSFLPLQWFENEIIPYQSRYGLPNVVVARETEPLSLIWNGGSPYMSYSCTKICTHQTCGATRAGRKRKGSAFNLTGIGLHIYDSRMFRSIGGQTFLLRVEAGGDVHLGY